jgi:hypothetical protein
MTHPYLQNKIITIEAIAAPEKWIAHYNKFKGEVPEILNNLKNKPYMFPNTERKFCAPAASVGVKPTLNNTEKNPCPDMHNEELTEQEYFEKRFNKNLNPYLPTKENWWTSPKENPVPFPTIKDGKLRLNLSDPKDMIQYRIFENHYRDEIAFSSAELRTNKLNTYLYVIKDSKVEDTASLVTSKLKMEAAVECNKISDDKESIVKFFACLGRFMDSRQSLADLQKPLFALLEENPIDFLKACKDPDIDIKYTIQKARKAGVITYDAAKAHYILPSGKRGKFEEVVEHLKQLNAQEEYLNLELEVDSKAK